MLNHVRDLATAIIASGARRARAVAAAQAGDQLASKLTSRLRVDGFVDGFVGHVALGLVGTRASGYPRSAGVTTSSPAWSAPRASPHPACRACAAGAPLGAVPGSKPGGVRGIGQLAQRVALELAADGERRAPERAGGPAALDQLLGVRRSGPKLRLRSFHRPGMRLAAEKAARRQGALTL